MRVPAAPEHAKPLCHAEMGFWVVAYAIQGTGGMPERWGTTAHWGTFLVVLHYLEVTQ
jgi:hypothetical protein